MDENKDIINDSSNPSFNNIDDELNEETNNNNGLGNIRTYNQNSGRLNNLARNMDNLNKMNNMQQKLSSLRNRPNQGVGNSQKPSTNNTDSFEANQNNNSSGIGTESSSKTDGLKDNSKKKSSKLSGINDKIQLANNLNNIRRDPSQAKDVAVGVAKDAIKKKVIAWSIGALIGCLPFLLIFIVFVVVIAVIIAAIGGNNSDTNTSYTPYGDECGFTLRTTTLSKEEFKSKLDDYAKKTSYNKSNYQLFADNANNIYDIATSHNVNPELVVTRAISEGFAPGSGYNYWGINCTNTGGGKDCKSYSSFSKGVEAFVNTTNNDSTLFDFMKHYSYIGDYWYNPGSSSLGGCYYATYIYDDSNMPSHVKNACASSASKCYDGGGSGCVKTTKEDQDAYTNWQVSKMTEHRVNVFGEVDNSSCTTSNSNGNTGVDNIINLSDADAWNAIAGTSTNYGSVSETEMNKRMTTITVPIRVWNSTKKNDYETKKAEAQITVNSFLAPLFTAFFNDIYNNAPDFVINKSELYCYSYRSRTSGTSLSSHAYGAACDINYSTTGNGYNQSVYTKESWNKLKDSKEKMQIIYKDSKVVKIAHKYTLSWGGEWNSTTDAMHFSFIGDESRSSLQSKKSGG